MAIFILCVFKHIADFPGQSLDLRMLVLNREGRFHTESAPMESCRPAIIVSFGVTARYGPQPQASARGRLVAAKQESIPWQSFVFDAAWSSTIRNTSLGPLVKGGWAMTIFNFTTIRRRRSVSAYYNILISSPPVWGRLKTCAPVGNRRSLERA
jgi:hypothetical protein